MPGNEFGIFRAVKNAYLSAGREWRYLLRLSVMPFALQIATGVALHRFRPDARLAEQFLWNLPASIAFAWLMFAQARLLLFGERIGGLPGDAACARERERAMQVSVIVLLLFNMGMTAVAACMEWLLLTDLYARSAFAFVLFAFLTGGTVWGLRFSVLHIVAAAGYPIRRFLRHVHGMLFSFRLIGMALLCVLPFYIAGWLLSVLLLSPDGTVMPDQARLAMFLSALVSVLLPLLLNAAAVYALQDMLSREGARP